MGPGDPPSSAAPVGSSSRPAAARAASAKAAKMSAGLYSSTSSDGDSITSVSLVHWPVDSSRNRLRLRKVRSGAIDRKSGSSSMRVMPPSSAIRSAFASRKRCSWRADCTRKSLRSSAASAASSPSTSLRPRSIGQSPPCGGGGWSAVILEIGPHPLPEEHRMVALKKPFPGTMPQGAGCLIRFQAIQRRVVRQVQQDHVVIFRPVSHVEPTEELDAVLLLVLLCLARKSVRI